MSHDSDGQREQRFWRTIAEAAGRTAELERILQSRTPEEIYEFQDTFLDLAVELQDIPYSDFVADDQSEDGLEDIAHWVVSQGKALYEKVLGDPAQMPPRRPDPASDLFGVAYRIYRSKTNRPLDLM